MMNNPRRGAASSRGFTLVELLIVIGIVAVLISLLLPALSKARAQANFIICQSNLRAIGQAVVTYCVDNRGHLPERSNDGGGTPLVQDFVNLFQGRDIPWGYNTANYSYTDPGANLGRLIMRGYLGERSFNFTLNPSNNFPPSGTQIDDVMDPNVSPIRFCPAVRGQLTLFDAHLAYGSSYMINPHVAQSLVYANGTLTNWFNRIDQIPPTLCLACEFFFNNGVTDEGTLRNNQFVNLPGKGPIWSAPHRWGADAGQYSFNMVYSDGHVGTARDNYAYDPITGGSYGFGLGYSTGNRQFFDTLDVLETQADGRDPANQMALQGYGWVSVNKMFRYPQHSGSNPPTQGVPWK